jgi:hypothetical protein
MAVDTVSHVSIVPHSCGEEYRHYEWKEETLGSPYLTNVVKSIHALLRAGVLLL